MVERSRDDDYPDIVLEDTRADLVTDAVAHAANLVPVLGGVIASVLSGWSAEKKRDRIRETISGLALRLANLQSKVSDEYIRSDEFEDLLDQTLRRVANERHEEKRRLYRNTLVSALASPGAAYDEQLEFLRVIERLQLAHIAVLRTLRQPPNPPVPGARYRPLTTTQLQALRDRLPEMSEDTIAELMRQLDDLRIVNGASLRAMGTDVVDLRNNFTDFGRRFVAYVLEEKGSQ